MDIKKPTFIAIYKIGRQYSLQYFAGFVPKYITPLQSKVKFKTCDEAVQHIAYNFPEVRFPNLSFGIIPVKEIL